MLEALFDSMCILQDAPSRVGLLLVHGRCIAVASQHTEGYHDTTFIVLDNSNRKGAQLELWLQLWRTEGGAERARDISKGRSLVTDCAKIVVNVDTIHTRGITESGGSRALHDGVKPRDRGSGHRAAIDGFSSTTALNDGRREFSVFISSFGKQENSFMSNDVTQARGHTGTLYVQNISKQQTPPREAHGETAQLP